MLDVRIINGEAAFFKDDAEVMNLEHLRDYDNRIVYDFDDGSYVGINSDNTIVWYDSNGK